MWCPECRWPVVWGHVTQRDDGHPHPVSVGIEYHCPICDELLLWRFVDRVTGEVLDDVDYVRHIGDDDEFSG